MSSWRPLKNVIMEWIYIRLKLLFNWSVSSPRPLKNIIRMELYPRGLQFNQTVSPLKIYYNFYLSAKESSEMLAISAKGLHVCETQGSNPFKITANS